MKKICIVNAHWSNRGDEAALRPIINELLYRYKNCKITVVFKDKEEVQQFPYRGNADCFSAKFLPDNYAELLAAVITRGKVCRNVSMQKEIKVISQQDLIIYSPGGSVINDRFWWRKQMEYLLPFLCARRYHIPMIVAAPSVGPFENCFWRNFIRRKLLQVPVRLCVREDLSQKYLMDIGVCRNVVTTIDTAFYDMPDTEENDKILKEYKELNVFLESYDKIAGMTITDFSWHVEFSQNVEMRENTENVIRDFILKRKEEGTGILLIPQLFGNQNDRMILEKFQDENTFILSEKWDTYFQQFIISKLYAVVGMRYHSNIFAAKMGIPFIAVAYEEKMRGFMEMWKLDEYGIDVRKLSAELLEDKWNRLVSQHEDYRQCLHNYRSTWKIKAGDTIREIRDILDN